MYSTSGGVDSQSKSFPLELFKAVSNNDNKGYTLTTNAPLCRCVIWSLFFRDTFSSQL